ncbi:hypothetical protein [Azohydromonas lata]|uniref:Uncharacterized protein n=1 Tax=Azohydromonas lata TaxID=45677 RepID=A0ABU5IP54_9BURK|nr:hypothetical protein [Azohydromonas lata]MDZ5460651.1 hypothetical protein [Azohydromonas lata]
MLTVETPATVRSSAYEGEMVDGVSFFIKATSHPEALQGKTLYLIAEIPDAGLFQPQPLVSIDTSGTSGSVQLVGLDAPDGARTYSGNITIHACLDPQCNSPLTVVNSRIPYEIRVLKGLSLGTEEITLAADFGTMPTPAGVSVQLPDDVASWDISPTYNADFRVFKVTRDTTGATPRIGISANTLALPDTSMDEFVTVTATTARGATLRRSLHMVQATGAVHGRAWAFQRPEVTFEMPSSGPGTSETISADALFPGGDSDRFRFVGVSYEWPAAAQNDPRRDAWLRYDQPSESSTGTQPSQQYGINLSADRCYNDVCLPAGTYRAVMHYTYSPAGGGVQNVDYTVTLKLLP